jgi:hypothetical protein
MGAAASDEASTGSRDGSTLKAAVADPKVAAQSVAEGLGIGKDALPEVLKEGKNWNTHNLGSRLGVDAMCAAAAGGLVAPVIAIVDK